MASYLRTCKRAGVASLATTAVLAALLIVNPGTAYAATAPDLGAADSFAVLAGQSVTNTGPTVVEGDLGVSPGSAVMGFPPGSVGSPGSIHAGDATAAQAQSDLTTAYNDLAGRSPAWI